MKERPIRFNAPMVRALLTGTKTQTRRFAKGLSLEWLSEGFEPAFVADDANRLCPYGQPGDRLWVREAWHASRKYDDLPPREIPNTATVEYNADDYRGLNGRFRQSMFMPRWASRITLEIVSVRVERLRDISEADSAAEGIVFDPHVAVDKMGLCSLYRIAYRELWESINGSGSWDVNPWVWVVEFKRVMP